MDKIKLLLSIFALFFTSCTNITPTIQTTTNNTIKKPKVKTQKIYPKWVINPTYDGSFGVVTIVKLKTNEESENFERRKKIIIDSALSKAINSEISAIIKSYKEVLTNGQEVTYKSDFSMEITAISQNLIKSAIIKNEWIDEDKKEAFYWAIIGDFDLKSYLSINEIKIKAYGNSKDKIRPIAIREASLIAKRKLLEATKGAIITTYEKSKNGKISDNLVLSNAEGFLTNYSECDESYPQYNQETKEAKQCYTLNIKVDEFMKGKR